MPATIELSGTSFGTTAPAATIVFLPTVTPGKIVNVFTNCGNDTCNFVSDNQRILHFPPINAPSSYVYQNNKCPNT